MIIVRAIAFLLHFTLVPFAIGRLITYRVRKGLISDYLIGFFGNLAIFYVLYSIITWIQIWITFEEPVTGGFSLLLKVYLAVVFVLLVAWLVVDRKFLNELKPLVKTKMGKAKNVFKKDKFSIIYAVVFAGLLCLQLYMAFGYEINEWSYDDFDYVVSSQDTISFDALSYVNYIDGSMPNVAEKRAASSWTTFIAMLSKVSGFEATTVCHTILPVILLLMAYLVFYYIAKFLFRETDNRLIFLILLSVAYIFGLYSHYSTTFRLLAALWQGKAVITVIAVPFFTLYLIRTYTEKLQNGSILPILAVSIGASSLTSLSFVFIPIVAVVIWMVMCVYYRKIYGVRYLIASLIGPIYAGGFYILVWMLQKDMQSFDFKYFPFREKTDWWDKWFQ